MIPFQATELFRPYLLSGERVLWSGRPKQGIAFSGRDTLLIPFSLLWGGFALFWNIGVWTFPETGQGIDWFMRLWGLPFLLAGIYFVIGRFLHDAAIRKKLHYAVTDQRVLVLRGSRSLKVISLDLHRLPRLELSEHRDGTGSIAFDTDSSSSFGFGRNGGFDWWVPSLSSTAQFLRIADPLKVYDLIRTQAHSWGLIESTD